jgi:hypothetical protein
MYRQNGVLVIVTLMILVLIPLSGCIGPEEIAQRLQEKIETEEQYEWIEALYDVQTFRLLDIINQNVAKIEDYPPLTIKTGTQYLHISFTVEFTNLVDSEWSFITSGYANITLTDPSGTNTSREFSALGKGNEFSEFFYIANPTAGNWHIRIEVRGVGKYTVFAQTYEPV